MKNLRILFFATLLLGATTSNAQGVLDKIDRTLNKADRASNTADRAGKTGSKLTGLLGKKKDAGDVKSETSTKISVNGATFASLQRINEKIQENKTVTSTKMKFNAASSTITVQHVGSTEELLKVLQKTNPTIFSEQNIEGLDEGQIIIKLKK